MDGPNRFCNRNVRFHKVQARMGRRKKPLVYTIRHSTILLDGTLRPNYPVSPPDKPILPSKARSTASNSVIDPKKPHPPAHEEAEKRNVVSGTKTHSEYVGPEEEDRKPLLQRRMQKGLSSGKKAKPAELAGGVSKISKGAKQQTTRTEKLNISCKKTVPDKPVCGAQEQSQKAQGVDEIDHLFATAKAAIAQQQSGEQAGASQAAVKGSTDDIFGNGIHRRRGRTEEGYAIYLEEELNLNRGGDTPLCPFDCDCCF